MEAGYQGGQVNGGARARKGRGVLWLGVSQWSSGGATVASRAGAESEGEAGCAAKETEEVGKRKKVQGRVGKNTSVGLRKTGSHSRV